MAGMFLKHDFYTNFSGAVKAHDEALAKDVVSDEIAKVIVFDRENVINFINSQGIKAKRRINDRDILDTIYSNRKNKGFSAGISRIILNNNNKPIKESVEAQKMFTAREYVPGKSRPSVYAGEPLNEMVTEAIMSFEGSDIDSTKEKIETHKNNKTMIQAEGGYYRKIIIKTAAISVVSTAIVTAGLIYGIGYFRKSKAGKAAVANPNPAPGTTPVVPATPPPTPAPMPAQAYNEKNFGEA